MKTGIGYGNGTGTGNGNGNVNRYGNEDGKGLERGGGDIKTWEFLCLHWLTTNKIHAFMQTYLDQQVRTDPHRLPTSSLYLNAVL